MHRLGRVNKIIINKQDLRVQFWCLEILPLDQMLQSIDEIAFNCAITIKMVKVENIDTEKAIFVNK